LWVRGTHTPVVLGRAGPGSLPGGGEGGRFWHGPHDSMHPFCTLLPPCLGCFAGRGYSKSPTWVPRLCNRHPAGPYSRNIPRLLWWCQGGWRFLMSEVPLHMYRTVTSQHCNQPCLVRQARLSFITTPHYKGNVREIGLFSLQCTWNLKVATLGNPFSSGDVGIIFGSKIR